MKIKILLLILFLGNTTWGQQAILTGSVQNEQTKEALDFATITIKNVKDTSLVLGAKSLTDGTYPMVNTRFIFLLSDLKPR